MELGVIVGIDGVVRFPVIWMQQPIHEIIGSLNALDTVAEVVLPILYGGVERRVMNVPGGLASLINFVNAEGITQRLVVIECRSVPAPSFAASVSSRDLVVLRSNAI